MSMQSTYRGKRVLITGLTGFKGIWLGLWLRELGATIDGLSLPATRAMQDGWPHLNTYLPSQHGDIRDADAVNRIVRAAQPDIIFHLAAQPLVRLSYLDPIGTYSTNVMGTAHVIQAARNTPSVKAMVVITTDKCYENREWHWGYRESDPVGGHDPYSSSKACAEIVAASFRRAFPKDAATRRLATARAGNVIGGGDWAEDRLIPDMVRALHREEPIFLRRPKAQRPWQHVLEPLSGYIALGAALLDDQDGAASAWNFGPMDLEPLTVSDIAHQFVKSWGHGSIIAAQDDAGPHEAHYLKLDSSKAVAELGWQPMLNAQERLQWTVDWYKCWQNAPQDIWDYTKKQIQLAEERIRLRNRFGEIWARESHKSKAA